MIYSAEGSFGAAMRPWAFLAFGKCPHPVPVSPCRMGPLGAWGKGCASLLDFPGKQIIRFCCERWVGGQEQDLPPGTPEMDTAVGCPRDAP